MTRILTAAEARALREAAAEPVGHGFRCPRFDGWRCALCDAADARVNALRDAAPDLAATVEALTEERDALRDAVREYLAAIDAHHEARLAHIEAPTTLRGGEMLATFRRRTRARAALAALLGGDHA